jgi:hypothetical protein
VRLGQCGWARRRTPASGPWRGFWNNLAQGSTAWIYNSYASKQVDYDCAGTGTEIYRVVVDAYVTGGKQMISAQSADDYYTTCSGLGSPGWAAALPRQGRTRA